MIENMPFSLGYTMPAEWERHHATWISWPKNPNSFRGNILRDVEKAYVRMVEELSANEKVEILVDGNGEKIRIADMLDAANCRKDNVNLHIIPTKDVWIRDYGPIFVRRADIRRIDLAYTHWKFNAWGNKYGDMKDDTRAPEMMPLNEFRKFKVDMVLEGGSVDTNGLGTFLTTEQCLLNKNRNPELSKGEIEGFLRNYLGALNIIWLGEGLEGDDTDGHVDDIARFVSKDTVVCAYEENTEDSNCAVLERNLKILENAKDQDDGRLRIIKMPMPEKVEVDEMRLPASYLNFYIANKLVLVPTFDSKNDSVAIGIMEKLFPDRKVVGIDCRGLVEGFGAIHCATQQQPAY